MARPLRTQYSGAFYHVTSRGNERKDVFLSTTDREPFLGYLESATCRYWEVIHAYCLLSNHYHLLLETPAGNLSEIMRHINGAYATYFNTKRKRVGMAKTLEDYRWSSYAAYVGLAEPAHWLKTDFVLSLLGRDLSSAQSRYRSFVETGGDVVDESPLNNVVASTNFGSEAFVQEVVECYAGGVSETERPAVLKKLIDRPSIDNC